MARTYCGNDANFAGLAAGTHVIGTKYQCLRKGIGIGRNLPYDASYAGPHAPIDQRRFYCGNAPVLPAGGGHFAMGSPSKCLQVGIGVGKAQRAAMGPPAFMYFIRYVLPYILMVSISGIIFAVLYYTKPNFVSKKDKDNRNIVDWGKLIPFHLLFSLIVIIIIWWFWKRFVRRWI